MQTLTVHQTYDGYVIAAQLGSVPRKFFYHPDCGDGECMIVRYQLSPRSMAQYPGILPDLLLQGTSDQVYSDGYRAYSALFKIAYSSGEVVA